jgi:hypothetical protein
MKVETGACMFWLPWSSHTCLLSATGWSRCLIGEGLSELGFHFMWSHQEGGPLGEVCALTAGAVKNC